MRLVVKSDDGRMITGAGRRCSRTTRQDQLATGFFEHLVARDPVRIDSQTVIEGEWDGAHVDDINTWETFGPHMTLVE